MTYPFAIVAEESIKVTQSSESFRRLTARLFYTRAEICWNKLLFLEYACVRARLEYSNFYNKIVWIRIKEIFFKEYILWERERDAEMSIT